MDNRICKCDPGGTVNVQGPDFGRTFGRGAEVDFDAPVTAGASTTWGQALDRYAHLFESPAAVQDQRQRSSRKSLTTPPVVDAPDSETKD